MVFSAEAARQNASLEDGEVVRRVRAGETALFEVLMRRHDQRVYRTVRAILRDEDEVEDAMQQAWIQAYLHLGEFEGTAALSTWLMRILGERGPGAPAAPLPARADDRGDAGGDDGRDQRGPRGAGGCA